MVDAQIVYILIKKIYRCKYVVIINEAHKHIISIQFIKL